MHSTHPGDQPEENIVRTPSRTPSGPGRHLAIALILKIVLLTLIWHTFIKPHRVTVDDRAMGAHLAGSARNFPTPPGESS